MFPGPAAEFQGVTEKFISKVKIAGIQTPQMHLFPSSSRLNAQGESLESPRNREFSKQLCPKWKNLFPSEENSDSIWTFIQVIVRRVNMMMHSITP
jgi:hypothetical protein